MTVSAASWSALFRGRHLAYTVLLTLGVGVHAFGIHLVATVLPSVVTDIGGAAFYAWATMLYIMASIMGTACGGLARARLDLRRGYVAGALVVLCGWFGCAVAPNIAVLLAARAIQGLGSGLLVALAYGMVSEFYAEGQRARVLSAISGIWGIAALLGPMVGGVFAAGGWWRGAFWAAIPVLILLCGLAWYALPAVAMHRTAGGFPALRLTLLGLGVLCVAMSGHVSALALRLVLVVSAVGLVGLAFRLDSDAASRLFPSQPLSLSTVVGTASWIFFLFGTTTSLVTVYMPLILHVLHGVSLLSAGYFNALLSLSWTILALGSASLQDRQVRNTIVFGPLLMLAGAMGLSMCVLDGPLYSVGVLVALIGAGIGVCFAHISSWTMAAARAGEEAVTASSIPTIQSLGIAFGAAVAGLAANVAGLGRGVSPETVAAATGWVYWLGIISPIALVILSGRLLWLHQRRSPHRLNGQLAG
ncbi:MAG TPA: MFS transporter [Candidatus Tectomicrobia bacterium]|nr:MFS transporter [Candidatus Tectomicrobia bacterium]